MNNLDADNAWAELPPYDGDGDPFDQYVADMTAIDENITCITCGYMIRGIDPQGDCPECGTPVNRSLHGDLLRFRDPRWLQLLARGMMCLLLWFALSIVLMVGGFMVAMIMTINDPMRDPSTLWLLILVLPLNVLGALGTWWLTEPDPSRDFEASPFNARMLARWTILLSIIFGAAGGVIDEAQPYWAPAVILSATASILAVFGGFVLLVYLRQLALRVPDISLAMQTRLIFWGYLVGVAVILVGGTVSAIAMAAGASSGSAPHTSQSPWPTLGMLGGGFVFCAGLLAFIALSIWVFVLYVLYWLRFRTAFEQALAMGASYDQQ